MKRTIAIFSLTCLSLSCSGQELEEKPDEMITLTVMTYNIRHGAGADGIVDLDRIANVILSAEPDLVALQEVDRFVERTNRTDQATILQELTGMHMRFGFADNYQGGDFGNLILSKHPIESLALHPLPGPPGETRVLMEAVISFSLDERMLPITFMATHLETFEGPRRDAAAIIKNILPQTPGNLVILGGDLNALPTSPTLDTLTVNYYNATPAPVFTHPAVEPVRQLDYLIFNGPPSWSVERTFTLDAPVSSDHLPLVAVFKYQADDAP